ncbi:MAG: hypothetical protein OXC41_03535 [Gammaproteobacteria bacterium]|nr:hypothetical protein [Gammaproteobacteria bacterium]
MWKKIGEMFLDHDGGVSSMRVMSVVALVGGLAAFLLQVSGKGDCSVDYELVYVTLFGAALGGKAVQKKFEKGV